MDSVFVGIIVVPGITALLLLLIFSYLYQQSRESYFRAWQIGWASLTLYYAAVCATLLGYGNAITFSSAKVLQLFTVLTILASTQLTEGERYKPVWYEWLLGVFGLGFIAYIGYHHIHNGIFELRYEDGHLELEVLLASILLLAAIRFYRTGRQRDFLGFRLIALALAFWAILMTSRQFHLLLESWFGTVG